jgi:hypothetical protein
MVVWVWWNRPKIYCFGAFYLIECTSTDIATQIYLDSQNIIIYQNCFLWTSFKNEIIEIWTAYFYFKILQLMSIFIRWL